MASPLLSALNRALLDALAVFFPVDCVGCGTADRVLCAVCHAELAPTITRRALANGLPVYTAVVYRGVVRRTVLAFKEDGKTEIARFLAEPLRAALLSVVHGTELHGTELRGTDSGELRPTRNRGIVELAPVPTSAAAWRRRGFDPVALLCRRAGFRPRRVLVAVRKTRSQKTLGELDRASNAGGSLRARTDLSGRQFVVVDDIVTSGATLTEAHRAVLAAGGEVVCAVAVAYTERIFRHTVNEKEFHSDIAS